MKKYRWVFLSILCLLISACQGKPQPQTSRSLTIFAAASLTEAFTEMGEAFQAGHPGADLVINFAGSQQLVQQLAQGAPADVFASANDVQMQAAITAGRVAAQRAQVFAANLLVVIYPKGNPGGLVGIEDLGKPGLKLVLAAREVPAGAYSLQFVEKASQSGQFGPVFMEDVLANVVSYEENVRAVYSKVALGEADAGIVYRTDVPAQNPDGIGLIEIPADLNVVASYPIAPVADSVEPELAAAFVEFVLSTQGQEILGKYGFSPAP